MKETSGRLNYKNLLRITQQKVESSTSEDDREYYESVEKFLLSPRGVILTRARVEENTIRKVKRDKTIREINDSIDELITKLNKLKVKYE